MDAARPTGPVNAQNKRLPAINIAFDFSVPIFEWMSRPEQAYRGKRMGEAMQQLHRMANFHVSEGMIYALFRSQRSRI